jgi:phosphoribosylformylglycinamidine synthase
VVDIGDGLAISFKIESHNHPSAVEPYHGAATGVGGILRDIFTMGAKPIAVLDSLRFGNPDNPMVKHLMNGVVDGIADYGNCFGVPTVGGEIYFEDSYEGNPLINAMAAGLLKHEHLAKSAATGVGNIVVYVGAKTGRDGIHGATFASIELTEESEEKRTAVQVGDPFLEKLLLEATLEVIHSGNVVAIQDMGAAGLTCSSSEMAGKGEVGIEIDVRLVPQREIGMSAYEIMLSESQERMLLIVEPHNFDAVKAIFDKWDLEASIIGKVTPDGLLRVLDAGTVCAEIPAVSLVLGGEAPVYTRELTVPEYIKEVQAFDQKTVNEPKNYSETLKTLMASPNIASKRSIYRQYDHMVQINTIIEPGSDAAVVAVKGTNKAIALSTDCNGRYCYLNPYEGAKGAVAESARNIVCSGAKPIAVTNCLNFGNPYKPEVYWTFSEVIRGMSEACIKFATPVTGGNVSFYNENPSGAIYPTPVIGMLGLMNNVKHTTTQYFINAGDLIILLGKECLDIGGSEYLKTIHNIISGNAPIVDLDLEAELYQVTLELIESGLVSSAHDCSDGGLLVSVAESCFGPKLLMGAKLNFTISGRPDFALFGEAHSRIVISVKPDVLSEVEQVVLNHKFPYQIIGQVTDEDSFVVNDHIAIPISELHKIWSERLK